MESLEERVATLERRLHEGYDRIESTDKESEKFSVWEDFWLSLLAEYEEAYDQLWGKK